ncbi:MAG: hypothetical protein HQ526_07740, partial [Actinobacteria bacterium]|nr:hypothetical protein [Actinomycetota bacterium]
MTAPSASVRSAATGWQETRLKYLFEFERNGVWGDEPQGDDGDVVCVRVADFDRSTFRGGTLAKTVRSVPASKSVPRMLRHGDVLLEKSGGTPDKPVGCAVSYDGDAPAVCSNFIAQLRPRPDTHPRYVGLLMAALYISRRNVPFVKQTTGIQNLDSSGYLGIRVAVPPKNQQMRIADFLDRECAILDDILNESERLIALTDERDRLAIAQLVTGQNDDGETKKQGPWWLPATPSTWSPRKISRNFKTGSGTTPTSTESRYYDGTYPWLNSGECRDNVVSTTRKLVSDEALAKFSALKFYPPGSLVIAMYGAT